MQAIRARERDLSRTLLDGLQAIPGLRVWGITDRENLDARVPTVSFTLAGKTPRQVAEHLASRDIQVWDGNYYAVAIMERLGLQETGGMVRVGAVHYNTHEDIDRLVETVAALR
jgi:selenocysteine lyase/cysteine desulfurase